MERFLIRTDLDPGGLINASTDETGRPGDWHALGLPDGAMIVAVAVLPVDDPRHPEAFRLLVSYRAPEPPPPPRHLLARLLYGLGRSRKVRLGDDASTTPGEAYRLGYEAGLRDRSEVGAGQ